MDATTKRFWSHVEKMVEGCWLWRASKRHKGYGAFVWHDGNNTVQGRAHRYSWIIHRGAIPPGMCVLHKCDVPACVNPAHLFLGTKKDNNSDMHAKGRNKRGGSKTPVAKCRYKRGLEHHEALLTPEIVKAIRRDHANGLGYIRLGKKYGYSQSAMYMVVKRKTWDHVK